MKRLVLWLGCMAFAVAGYFAIIFSAYPAEAQTGETLCQMTEQGNIAVTPECSVIEALKRIYAMEEMCTIVKIHDNGRIESHRGPCEEHR